MRTPEQKRIAGIKQRQVTRQRLGHDDEKFHEINWLIKRIEELECVCDDDGQCLFLLSSCGTDRVWVVLLYINGGLRIL